MKTKILRVSLLTSFILLLGICIGCNSEDQPSANEKLTGIWDLKNVSGGFEGVDVNYESGTVSWEFDPETNTITVLSSVPDTSPQSDYLPLQSGNYNYTLTEVNGKTYIEIEGFQNFDNGEYGQYEITNLGELKIDQGLGSEANANDVFILSFD